MSADLGPSTGRGARAEGGGEVSFEERRSSDELSKLQREPGESLRGSRRRICQISLEAETSVTLPVRRKIEGSQEIRRKKRIVSAAKSLPARKEGIQEGKGERNKV